MGLKWPVHEAEQLLPSSFQVKNQCRLHIHCPICLNAMQR